MPSKKKHLRYRAAKEPASKEGPVRATDQTSVPPAQKTPTKPSGSVKQSAQAEPYTRMTPEEQKVVRKDLRHIGLIAVVILLVYAIFWAGFHYGGWSESILRLIPHGQ